MNETYHIRIEKPHLVFSAAHFITYDRDVCERLHGHNYHVTAEIHGPLDENHYVADFIAVRDALQTIVDALDHRMLLPTKHRSIEVVQQDSEIVVSHGERRWIFPEEDCVLLPVANTTAELLARHLGDQLLGALQQRLGLSPQKICLAVDECDGQWGVCELIDP